jgi:opacity protein-like surface antigen
MQPIKPLNCHVSSLKRVCLGSLLLFPCASLFAMDMNSSPLSNLEFSAAIGPAWANSSGSAIYNASSLETDTLYVDDRSSLPTWKLGLGYHFFTNELAQRSFFNDLLVEFNYYHGEQTLSGPVWWYAPSQAFNNYNFNAPIESSRYMLDVKPSLFTYDHLSFYPIVGAGLAVNIASYQESAISGAQSSTELNVGNHTSDNFSYDLGAGIRANLSDHLEATLEYLYSNLGQVAIDGQTSPNNSVISLPKFNVSSQAVMFGINIQL